MQHLVATGPARLQLPDRGADVRAHTVVHVTQDPAALAAARLLLHALRQALVTCCELNLFLRHAPRQAGVEFHHLLTRSAETLQHDHPGHEAEQQR